MTVFWARAPATKTAAETRDAENFMAGGGASSRTGEVARGWEQRGEMLGNGESRRCAF